LALAYSGLKVAALPVLGVYAVLSALIQTSLVTSFVVPNL